MGYMIYKTEIYEIVGVCMKVYNQLGYGFLEVVYKDAMEIEFMNNQMMNEREKEFQIEYKGRILKRTFNADFFMMDKIIVEVKSSKDGLIKDNIAQTLNYLKASGCQLGLVVNFGKTSLEYKRLIF